MSASMKLKLWGVILAASLLAGCSSSQPDNDGPAVAAGQTRLQLGLEYLNQGDLPAARQNLQNAVDAAPQDYRTQLGMALYNQRIGDNAAAEQRYQQALKLAPGNGTVLNNYGAFLCSLGQYVPAQQQFSAAALAPEYGQVADSLENAGYCFLKAGQNDEARKLLTRALKIQSGQGGSAASGSRKAIWRREARAVATFIGQLSTCSAGECRQSMVTDSFRRVSGPSG